MTAFVLLGGLLVAATLAALLPTLLRRRDEAARVEDLALDTYRSRLAELEQEHARGVLSAEGLREATDELERELLQSEATGAEATVPTRERPARATALALAIALPLGALAMYLAAGQPGLLGGGAELSRERALQLQQLPPPARIDALEDWLAGHPDSARAWGMLGQAYRETEAYGDAANAFGRARAAGANDAWLIARQAEVLLLANDREFTRGVRRLLDEALRQDARNALALMLSGQAEFLRGNPEAAAGYWRRLAEILPEDSQQRTMMEQLVVRAEQAAAGETAPDPTPAPADGDDARIEVRVSLAEPLAGEARPGATVFVFARRPGAGGPPLAVARARVADLPVSITLTDADAMAPQARLSQADEVVVTARVSATGEARPRSGDLEGRSQPAAVGDRVEVIIDQRLP